MARQENRLQREEISRAQHLLRDWYGVRHDPVLNQEGRQLQRARAQSLLPSKKRPCA